jgi:hypothetical protein
MDGRSVRRGLMQGGDFRLCDYPACLRAGGCSCAAPRIAEVSTKPDGFEYGCQDALETTVESQLSATVSEGDL